MVEGPFRADMKADLASDQRWTKNLALCKAATGTRVIATTSFDYVRTTYRRARADMSLLPPRLAEHFGVFYRHFLKDPRNQIWIRWREGDGRWQDLVVPSISLPIGRDTNSWGMDVQVNGQVAHATYITGQIDEAKVKEGPSPVYPLMIYYQRTERTQGVDVVVRNRTILRHQLEALWPDQIRLRERNYFLGELILEGDKFSTVNNKISLDPHNTLWLKVIEQLNERPELSPPQYQTSREEADITKALKDILEKFESGTQAQINYPVWSGAGVKADIVHIGGGDAWLDVYEVKDDRASPQDVYQLIMYWDGLVNDGKSPRRGRLVAESAPESVMNLVKHWNSRTDLGNKRYNIEFKSIADLGVRIIRPQGPKKRRELKQKA